MNHSVGQSRQVILYIYEIIYVINNINNIQYILLDYVIINLHVLISKISSVTANV